VLVVRWYLRYAQSYRDVEELLAERGITVDHVTIYRCVQRFTPLLIGAVALCEAGAGVIVDPDWSDHQGQLVEGSHDPEVCYVLNSEFVVAAPEVLHERVPGADHPCAAELFEPSHRP